MAIRNGSIRLSPQDIAIREKFKHTMQRAIERIGKPSVVESVDVKWDYTDDYVRPWTYNGKNYLRSSTNEIWTDNPGKGSSGLGEWCGIYFPAEDIIYSGYDEPGVDVIAEDVEKPHPNELVLQSEPISSLQVDDILGMDKVEKEDHRRLQAEWKSKEAMLWNKIVDQENTIRAFQKQEQEWQTTAMKRADEIIAAYDTDHVEFDVEVELHKMFVSWFTHYDPSKEKAVKSYKVDSIKKIIKKNTQDISKNETIKVLLYQSYESETLDTWNQREYSTVAHHWLVTTNNIYQLRHFTNGSMWPFVRSGELRLDYNSSVNGNGLSYGDTYQWVKLCKTPQGIHWHSLRAFSNNVNGNINMGRPVYHGQVIDYTLNIERNVNAFYAILGVKRCMSTLREPGRQLPPGKNTVVCMEPCDGKICLRHQPFTTKIISHEHIIIDTNVLVDITTNTIMGWIDDSNVLQFNCKNHEEHLIADKHDLHRANEEERIQYSKRQK